MVSYDILIFEWVECKILIFENTHNSHKNKNIVKNYEENTDKVFKFKFHNWSIHSKNIKANITKLEMLVFLNIISE